LEHGNLDVGRGHSADPFYLKTSFLTILGEYEEE
jgi:hypothetical protein